MRPDYTPYAQATLARLAQHLPDLARIPAPLWDGAIIKNTLVAVGDGEEEKLFLLLAVVEEALASFAAPRSHDATETPALTAVMEALGNILKDISPTYLVRLPDVPGVAFPASDLFGAKSLAEQLPLASEVVFRDQILFSHAYPSSVSA